MSAFPLLQKSGLKDTLPRRLVFGALQNIGKTVSPYDVQRWLMKKSKEVNIVTIYRVFEAFEKAHIVHRHPCNGHFSLCSIPDLKGHHGFLHCSDCDSITEFVDERLCAIENAISLEARFHPETHVSEVVGVCSSCH
jgi:Fe2+ or Zn2+ uptake regulation protein